MLKVMAARVAALLIAICGLGFFQHCKPGPVVQAPVDVVQVDPIEAGGVLVNDACSLITAIDSSGALRTICATVEEVIQIVAFVATLRLERDAGAPDQPNCLSLPGTSYCATAQETSEALKYVLRVRAARFMLDAGQL